MNDYIDQTISPRKKFVIKNRLPVICKYRNGGYSLLLPLFFLLPLLSLLLPTDSIAQNFPENKLKAFAQDMETKHGWEQSASLQLLRQARLRNSILEAISRSAEKKKKWHEYRSIFLQDRRIREGVTFWEKHQAALQKAEQSYGVNPAVIVSIIGVETHYGRLTGKYPVLDSLATLAFAYPPRAAFFHAELEQFLLLTREQNLDPKKIKGSYAGAMGIPQFISSSYRNYAVDFDRDGVINLWDSTADAIGSVGNYLNRHGWIPMAPVINRAEVMPGADYSEILDRDLGANVSYRDARTHGIRSTITLADDTPVKPFEFINKNGTEVWLGQKNFYVITRYNHSSMYALAVWQLAEEIRTRYQQKTYP